MIYEFKTVPADFKPKFDCVACIFEHDNKILLLLRQDHKSHGNTWGLPAGKVEKGETLEQGLIREIFQETGYKVGDARPVYSFSVPIRYPDTDLVYHKYHLTLKEKPDVVIEPKEHKDFKWVTLDEAFDMNLIGYLRETLKMHYKIT